MTTKAILILTAIALTIAPDYALAIIVGAFVSNRIRVLL